MCIHKGMLAVVLTCCVDMKSWIMGTCNLYCPLLRALVCCPLTYYLYSMDFFRS